MINPLYEEIIAHKNGPLFLAPVREVSVESQAACCIQIADVSLLIQSDAPGYSKIVKQPMDLKKIKAKIRKGEISTIDEFQRDLWLIFWWVSVPFANEPTANICAPLSTVTQCYIIDRIVKFIAWRRR